MYPTEDDGRGREMIVAFKLGVQLLAPLHRRPGQPAGPGPGGRVAERLTIPALELFTRGIYTIYGVSGRLPNQRRADRNRFGVNRSHHRLPPGKAGRR